MELKSTDKITIGKYTINKRGKNTKDYSTLEKDSKWTPDGITEVTYNVAPVVYKKRNWQGTGYSVDDFTQDAVMYILDLYNRKYFSTDRDDVAPIIYRMLDGFFSINKMKELRKYSNRLISLDKPINDEHGMSSLMDLVDDGSSEESIYNAAIGDELISLVTSKLNFEPYKVRKHEYIGTLNGNTLVLSEKNIAELIFSGKTMHDILAIYQKEVDNIGSCSEASFIFHKVKQTVRKINDIISSFNADTRAQLESYFNKHTLNEPSDSYIKSIIKTR